MMAVAPDLVVKVIVDTSRYMEAMINIQATMRMTLFFQPYMVCQKRGWSESAYWAGIEARREGKHELREYAARLRSRRDER